jgi:hypothetical protein
MKPGAAFALAFALLLVRPAGAQERPKESEIFGQPPAQENPAPNSAPNPAPTQAPSPEDARSGNPESSRDDAILGASEAGRLAGEAAPEDPLKIGGLFYLRAQTIALQDESPGEWGLGAPALMDAYLDARPNQRVRGLIVGRLVFDPTLPVAETAPAPGQIRPVESAGSSLGGLDLASLFPERARGPHVSLDQMWLRFDLAHRVFVTAGKQHVRWGTGRFWTPTDFLHIRRRNPLDPFDARTGTTLVKLHAPWEARGWNFYSYGLLEDSDATPRLGNVAGAARAEVVIGTSELGAGALLRRGRKPRLGFDLSTGIWDLDLYGELAVRWGDEIDRITLAGELPAPEEIPAGTRPGDLVELVYPLERRSGPKAQVVGGASYSRKYNDNDVFHVALEYFYNPLGYDSPEAYPGLILPLPRNTPLREPATSFYLGRQYGALLVSVPSPYSWDRTSFTVSTVGNFSDRSFVTRIDYGLVLLTHLRFEAYTALHYGAEEGEFRFGIRNLAGLGLSSAPALLKLGIGLRVSL